MISAFSAVWSLVWNVTPGTISAYDLGELITTRRLVGLMPNLSRRGFCEYPVIVIRDVTDYTYYSTAMKRFILALIFLCAVIVFSLYTYGRYGEKDSPKLVQSTLSDTISSEAEVVFVPTMPSLDSIFSSDHTWTATLSADHIRTILVTGDIIPSRSVNVGVLNRNDPIWPYKNVLSRIRELKPDITFANLETPLLHDCLPTTEGMVFCGSDRNVAGLKAINVTVASLANNHAGNHAVNGVTETITHLHENGIDVTGVHGPLIKNIRGVKFAFLGYNDISSPQPGIASVTEELIAQEIAEAKKLADIVVVMFHWGIEYRAQPDERQKYLAHYTIDHGADVIVSNHPHWIQPVELYHQKLIMYAHGNFIFDQMWSEETKKGVLGLYTFYNKQLIDVTFLPLFIQNYGQATFMNDADSKKILSSMKKQSELLHHDSLSRSGQMYK